MAEVICSQGVFRPFDPERSIDRLDSVENLPRFELRASGELAMRRREFIALTAAISTCGFAARAQQPARQRRIAIVTPSRPVDQMRTNPYYQAFLVELARLGFVEGQNLLVDRYSGDGKLDGYADLARAVISGGPEAILTAAPQMTFALKAATQTIPIVTVIGDPVAIGLAESLARPGSNVTGITVDGGIELHGKRLSLLMEIRPHASRLAYLSSSTAWKQPQAAIVREVAQHSGLALTHLDLGRTIDKTAYVAAFALLENAKADALLVSDEPDHLSNGRVLVDLAARAQLPAMYPFRDLALAGGLMAYYRDLVDAHRQAADQVARLLNGENPAEMPFRQPTSFRLSINTKTAQQIGVTLPPMLLANADEVIE